MQKRKKRAFILVVSILFTGLVYAFICNRFHIGLPCIFNCITGLKCPGCGISRMCLALLRLDIIAAWQSNPVVLLLLPLGIAVFIDVLVRYIKSGDRNPKGWSKVAVWVMLVVLLMYGFIRNVPLVIK